jgi:hypothetical protein
VSVKHLWSFWDCDLQGTAPAFLTSQILAISLI